MKNQPLEYPVFRKRIDDYLAQRISNEMRSIADETTVSFIADTAGYLGQLVKGGGKRVRGYCAAQMYVCAGGENRDAALELAVAVELFHMFAIVQDDVMDKADARRGITTMHRFAKQWMQERSRHGDIDHVADMQAILWGDVMLAMASHTINTINAPLEHVRDALNCLYAMSVQTMVGQMGDVDTTTRIEVSDEELLEKTTLKTALYGFSHPMQIGAALAGAPKSINMFANAYGRALGTAFQIQDDIFDVVKSEAEMGKSVMNDVQAGEHSYLTHYLLNKGTAADRETFLKYFGRKLSESEIVIVKELFETSGAITYATSEMEKHFTEASLAVDSVPSGFLAEPWRELLALVRDRSH